MRKEIICIFVCLTLVLTTLVVIVPEDLKVEASSDGGGIGDNGRLGLDWHFIRNITENLSYVILNPIVYGEDELKMGRDFGSDGEHYAAFNILQDEMINLSLYNPGLDPPYIEQIQNIESGFNKQTASMNLTEKLEENTMGLTIYNENDDTNKNIKDFHIRPLWNWTFLLAVPISILENEYNLNPSETILRTRKTLLTNNFSYQHLKIQESPHYTDWFLNFIKSELQNLTTDQLINNRTAFNNYTICKFQDHYNFTYGELNQSTADELLPWYTDYWQQSRCDEPVVFIFDNRTFGANYTNSTLQDILQFIYENCPDIAEELVEMIKDNWLILEMFLWQLISVGNCKGYVYYD